jgi:hypothetical protein
MSVSTLQPNLLEISIVRLPLPRYPLSEAAPEGHSIMPRLAETEAAALAICGELVQDGYGVEVKGPNVCWDEAEVMRRVKEAKT